MSVVGKRACGLVVLALCALQGGPGFTQIAARPATYDATIPVTRPAALAFIEAPEVRTGHPTQQFPRGSRLVRLRLDAAGQPIDLATGFFAASDPQVSFDGRRIMFAAQVERSATWQIFVVSSDGGGAQQITHCAGDCVQPVYLPEKWIAYTALQGSRAERTSEVEVSRDDGANAHSITFGPGRFEVETVLRSGRLLLSAGWPLVPSKRGTGARALYLMDPDGSGLARLRQDDRVGEARSGATELEDGSIVFVRQGMGQLAWVRPGALNAVPIGTQAGYASPNALGNASLVVSRSSAGQQLDLYRVVLTGQKRTQLIYKGVRASSIQAVPIEPRPTVQAYRSILHPERASGRIICLDAYASKDVMSGRLKGHVARVRFVTKTQNGEKVLGDAPVDTDGSFYASVPADAPIRLMLIGRKGEILKQQQSWMWVRAGEDRGCFGCHESQAKAPVNRSPMTLQRMDTPTLLMGDAVAVIARKGLRP